MHIQDYHKMMVHNFVQHYPHSEQTTFNDLDRNWQSPSIQPTYINVKQLQNNVLPSMLSYLVKILQNNQGVVVLYSGNNNNMPITNTAAERISKFPFDRKIHQDLYPPNPPMPNPTYSASNPPMPNPNYSAPNPPISSPNPTLSAHNNPSFASPKQPRYAIQTVTNSKFSLPTNSVPSNTFHSQNFSQIPTPLNYFNSCHQCLLLSTNNNLFIQNPSASTKIPTTQKPKPNSLCGQLDSGPIRDACCNPSSDIKRQGEECPYGKNLSIESVLKFVFISFSQKIEFCNNNS